MAEHGAPPADNTKKDCGCGCGGDCGDKGNSATSPSPGRRALLTGASSAVLIATLANRRAFAQTGGQCGPISHIGSLQPSQTAQPTLCGGMTPGFWKNHANCTTSVLTSHGYTLDTALGTVLTNLHLVDATSAAMTFRQGLCNANSNASHWASAILCALSPGMNPQYGYTLTSLNAAILNAYNQGVTGAAILTALKTLENDYGIITTGCTNSQISCT